MYGQSDVCVGHAVHANVILCFLSGYAVNLSLEMSVGCEAVLIGVLKDDLDDQAFLILRAAVLQRMRSDAARQLADPSHPSDQATKEAKPLLRGCTWALLGTMRTLAYQCCIISCVNVLHGQWCKADHCLTQLLILHTCVVEAVSLRSDPELTAAKALQQHQKAETSKEI